MRGRAVRFGEDHPGRATRRALDAPVLHLDDVCPGWDGLADAVALLHEQVVVPLTEGRHAAYRRHDRDRGANAETVPIGRSEVLVVEEVGSGARPIAGHAVLRVAALRSRDAVFEPPRARYGSEVRVASGV